MKVGIDFGTCTSCICIDQNGKKQLIKCGTGAGSTELYIPSAVYLQEDNSLLVGQAAVRSKTKNPQRFIKEFKRNLGQSIPTRLGNKDFYPEQLVQEVFRYLKGCAEQSGILEVSHIDEVTICHPANFSNIKKEQLKKAALNAGFNRVNLLDEPTSASYYYDSLGKIKTGERLLIYDLGGGTFDVSLMEKTNDGLKLLTRPLGIEECGGADFDLAIYEHVFQKSEDDLESIMAEFPEDSRNLFKSELERYCVEAKEQLSSSDTAHITYQHNNKYRHFELERSTFEMLIKEHIDQTIGVVLEVIRNAHLQPKDVDKILLVGGSCRIPYIKQRLEKALGDKITKDVDPDWAVVYGATCNRTSENPKAPSPPKTPESPKPSEAPISSSYEQKPPQAVAKNYYINDKRRSAPSEVTYISQKDDYVPTKKNISTQEIILVDQNGLGNCVTLQQAINLANENSKIIVHSGSYIENLQISKSISITGHKETNEIIIQGNINIRNTLNGKVTLQNFTINGPVNVEGNASFDKCNFCHTETAIQVGKNALLEINTSIIQKSKLGLDASELSKVIIKNTQFINNIKGIRASGTVEMNNSKIEVTDPLTPSEQGISMNKGRLHMTNCEVLNYREAGIMCVSESKMTLAECTLTGNNNNIQVIGNGDLTIQNTKISKSTSIGIYALGKSLIQVIDSEFSYNNIGLKLSEDSITHIIQSEMHNDTQCGLVIVGNASCITKGLTITESDFGIIITGQNRTINFENIIVSENRIGLSIVEENTIKIMDAVFKKNKEFAIQVFKGKAIIKNSSFVGNRNGIDLKTITNIEVTNTQFSNVAGEIMGDIQYSSFIQCTFKDVALSHLPIYEPFSLKYNFRTGAVNEYLKLGPNPFGKEFYSCKDAIPTKMVEKAKEKFLGLQDSSSIIFFFNYGWIMKGSVGLAITDQGIYWRTDGSVAASVTFGNIKNIVIENDRLKILTKDNKEYFPPHLDGKRKYFLLKILYGLW